MSDSVRHGAPHALALSLCAMLAACSSLNESSFRLASVVTPYKVDVVQGNVVSSEQVALLQPGMPRQEVRDVLGTPLLQSVFHSDRWDYVFSFKHKGEEPQLRKVTVFFKNDILERFDADAVPTEAEFIASLASGRKVGKIPVLEASEESLKQFPVAAKKEPEAKPLPPLPSSYPPLETASP